MNESMFDPNQCNKYKQLLIVVHKQMQNGQATTIFRSYLRPSNKGLSQI